MTGGYCTLCSHHVDSFDGLKCCPNCGTDGPPCDDDKQVNISINIHELRVLGIWAENYACEQETTEKPLKEVVYAILRRVKKQLPTELQKVPLSMAEEFQEMRDLGMKFATNHKAADSPDLADCYDADLANQIAHDIGNGEDPFGEDLDDDEGPGEPT